MSNALQQELKGKTVIFRQEDMAPGVVAEDHPFHCEDGFGCSPHTSGRAIIGYFVEDGEKGRIDGWMVDRIATEDEIEAAKAKAAQS